MISTPKRSWQMVVADDLDHDMASRINKFVSTFASSGSDRERRTIGPEYYIWKIRENPNGPGFVTLAVDKDKVVGTTTVTRKKVFFCGQVIDAAEIGDTYTDPNYQRQGIFSSLVNASRERAVADGIRLIYGTPNEKSLAGYEKNCSFFRKRDMGLFLFGLPLKPLKIASQKVFSVDGSSICRYLDKIVSYSFGTLSTLIYDKGCNAELGFEHDFDALNEKLKRRFSFMLSRGSSDLKFRYISNPDSSLYKLIVKRDKMGGIKAALIYKKCFQNKMKIMFIADMFGENHTSMIQVWNRAVLEALRNDFDLIALWTKRRPASFLNMFPIVSLPLARKEVIFYNSDMGMNALKDSDQWLFSIADSDNI